MKIHVLGSRGMLGSHVSKYLKLCGYQVVEYDRERCSVETFQIDQFTRKLKTNDIIVNCIGLLKPNITSFEQAKRVNYDFPLLLDNISTNTGCRLINFSSDCVFTGKKGQYTEIDSCDAEDWYGLTKQHDELKTTVMRLSFIGEELFHKIGLLEFGLKNSGKTVTGYTNCMWNGVTALEIAKIIDKMIRNDGVSFWTGIRHVYSNKVLSKYDILSTINKIYRLNSTVIPTVAKEISGTEIENTLDRSLATVYNKIEVPTLEDMIYEQRNFIHEN